MVVQYRWESQAIMESTAKYQQTFYDSVII